MMTKVVLNFNKEHGLMSMFSFDGFHSQQFRLERGDNKVIIKHPREVQRAMELLFGKKIKHTPKGAYCGISGDYYEFDLPVSKCGKYLLIKNPNYRK